MIVKPCIESKELMLFRSLNARMNLSPEDTWYYTKLEKGFQGEFQFNQLLLKSPGDYLIVNDLLLEKNNTTFQIDTLLISQNKIFHFEVKNYEGDYFLEKDKWYTNSSKISIVNPITQLERSSLLLRKLFQDFGSNLALESYLIFINPEFTLYHAPANPSIVFPTQLNRFIRKLNLNSSIITGFHHTLAEKIISQHFTNSQFTRIPKYEFEQLKKGIIGTCCHSFLKKHKDKYLICDTCGKKENSTEALLRAVNEYKLLFPHKKITTNDVYEWCNGIKSKNTIRRILIKNYHHIHRARSSYFVSK